MHKAAILALVLLAGCARGSSPEATESTLPVTTNTTAPRPSGSLVGTTTSAPERPTPTMDAPVPATSAYALPTGAAVAEDCARQVVNGLIARTRADVAHAELWGDELGGGQIIQVTTLAATDGRATVAVSLAFTATPSGPPPEPVGLRVELLLHDAACQLVAVGFL